MAAKPNGDLTPLNGTTMVPEPIQTKVLRADNTSNTTCVRSGVQGIRIRVEGGSNAAFCPEFDEIRMGTTFASATNQTTAVSDYAPLTAQISPNPVRNTLTIALENVSSRTSISVYNVLGNNVLSTQFYGNQSKLDVSNLSKGLYIISVQNEGKKLIQKFVKE